MSLGLSLAMAAADARQTMDLPPGVGLVMAVALLVNEQTGVQVDQVLVAFAALHVGDDAARARGRRLGVQVPAGPVIAGARSSSGRRALDD